MSECAEHFLLWLIRLNSFLAQVLSRSLNRDETQSSPSMRRRHEHMSQDSKKNYSESKLMSALFARYTNDIFSLTNDNNDNIIPRITSTKYLFYYFIWNTQGARNEIWRIHDRKRISILRKSWLVQNKFAPKYDNAMVHIHSCNTHRRCLYEISKEGQ